MLSEPVLEYIKSIEKPEYKAYIIDLFDQISKKGKKVAYHFLCTDGVISAALLKYLGWGEIFVPLDYNVLKNDILRPNFVSVDWYIIIDLEPFNKNTLELFVDHHRSVIGSKINSRRIHYEVGENGPSAAYVLYNLAKSHFDLPAYISELAEISKVTDTASYKIDPPAEKIDLSGDKSFLTNFDKLCWFVLDATNIEDEFTLKANNDLVDLLAKGGVKNLLQKEVIKRVNKHREKRIVAENYIKNLEISDLMVIINAPNHTFKQYCALKLGKIGAKVIVFLTEREKNVTISLRQSKKNTKAEIENLRLDLLAKRFDETGGGHAEASGSACPSVREALDTISTWKDEKGLSMNINYYKEEE